jgi:phosphoserine phosphatase RsbU/P
LSEAIDPKPGTVSNLQVDPAAVVSNVNKQLYAFTAPEKYSTFFCAVFDETTEMYKYCNAGHLPPILIQRRNGGAPAVARLDVNGMVVGCFAQAVYDSSEVEMQSGDLLVFFSDGITEPEDAYGEMFGEERLIDLLIRNLHLTDDALIDTITSAVKHWSCTEELQDDMTLLLIRGL